MTAPSSDPQANPDGAPAPDLPAAARRAGAEAARARPPLELGGRDGPEPVRFGDWEKKGIAIDF